MPQRPMTVKASNDCDFELRTTFRTYWQAGTHVAIDECIEGFCGRATDTVSIPTKPLILALKYGY